MKKIELIIRTEKLALLKGILTKYEYSGLTVMSAMDAGTRRVTAKNLKSWELRSISFPAFMS